MRYEKKMLILSGGDSKGVVLIERSGLGVRFAVRTFSMPARNGLMAGVITRSDVYIRELPSVADPSAVFYLDDVDIPSLHFAVFDDKLRLYGTFGKKMWESNVMGLLTSKLKPISAAPPPSLPALPPIAEKPKVLPLPDGTGIPQSRLSVYGDDALADSDFYTTYDFSSRMSEVDKFLDTPRILDGLAPTVKPPQLKSPSLPQSDIYTPMPKISVSARAVPSERAFEEHVSVESEVAASAEEAESAPEDPDEPLPADELGQKIETKDTDENDDHAVDLEAFSDETEISGENDTYTEPESEAASVKELKVQPWQYEAMFLKKRATRVPTVKREEIAPPTSLETVAHLRETSFIERCRADIDKLFSIADRDAELMKLLPDIEWVRVEFDGHTVCVGRSKVFLCYAVAGRYEKISPLGEEAQWLPSVQSMPTGKGYWLIFQDLVTGEIIRTC